MNTKTCPVCGMEIKDGGKHVNVEGKDMVVCCESCVAKAKANAKKYATSK